MRTFCLALLVFAIASPLRAGEDPASVTLTKNDTEKTVTVKIGDELFAVYHYGEEFKKPFFLPVYAPGKIQVTRALDDPNDKDHPHHKGIWISVDEVNGIKYWKEDGRIKTEQVEIMDTDQGAQLKVVNHWLDQEGDPLLREATLITIYPNRVMAYTISMTALEDKVTFEDTKEGFFAFRMFATMKESQGGTVIGANEMKGTKNLWGKATPWIDYYGKVDGETVGVALFDNPSNPRPSRYHVRDYGLFGISPFGEKAYTSGANPAAPFELEPGASLKLQYGIYIHKGTTEEANVKQAYEQYVQRTKEQPGSASGGE